MFDHNIVNKFESIHMKYTFHVPAVFGGALHGKGSAADTWDYYITLYHLVLLSFILCSHHLFFMRISNECKIKMERN